MSGELLELVTGPDRTLHAKVLHCIHSTIANSFKEDGSRVTQSEAARRFNIIIKLVRELRSEHSWAFTRIMDALPIALRSKLDGTWWDPNLARNTWSTRKV